MPTATIRGLHIEYEVYGEPGSRSWVIIPGGRVSKDGAGIRELAQELARRGDRALIWDRPNAGASDVCFTGPTEAAMHADVLAELLAELDLGPAIVCGGSAGARLSLTWPSCPAPGRWTRPGSPGTPTTPTAFTSCSRASCGWAARS